MSPADWNSWQLMARFNQWVNRRLQAVVDTVCEPDYRADLGLFFGSIHCTLNHLLVVDRLWMGRIEGRAEHGLRLDAELYADRDALRDAREAQAAALVALVDGLDDAALAAPVHYRRILGQGMQATRRDHMLLTLFNHQTHHRGHVTAALTRLGHDYADLDVIFFLEEVGLS